MFIGTKNQANTDTCQPQYSKQECCTTAFPIAKQLYKQAASFLHSHDRLKYLIYQQSAEEISQWDGEKLKRVPSCKNSALDFYRNIQTVNGI